MMYYFSIFTFFVASYVHSTNDQQAFEYFAFATLATALYAVYQKLDDIKSKHYA